MVSFGTELIDMSKTKLGNAILKGVDFIFGVFRKAVFFLTEINLWMGFGGR